MSDLDITITIEHEGTTFRAVLDDENSSIYEVVETMKRGLIAIGFSPSRIDAAVAGDL